MKGKAKKTGTGAGPLTIRLTGGAAKRVRMAASVLRCTPQELMEHALLPTLIPENMDEYGDMIRAALGSLEAAWIVRYGADCAAAGKKTAAA